EAALAALAGLPEAAPGHPFSNGVPDGPLDEARAAQAALELAGRVDALDGACRALVRRRAAHPQEPTC
ncbi:hypothetical protein, partial [uncultured Desulfovibrio sp.]|uniref:hypothetical protein n=1 Tax=uncultured Desulfovibrio sp. TaxID=167968 RepID=UPI0026147DFA